MKSPISFLITFSVLGACNSWEITRLQLENDSLWNDLKSHQIAIKRLGDIGMWIDSIDASRSLLITHFKEAKDLDGFSTRLRNINEFVKRSEEKIELVQNALKSSNVESSAYLMLVDALKSEVQLRVDELIKLNDQVTTYKNKNAGLEETIKVAEGEVGEMSELASSKEQELLILEARIQALVDNFNAIEADGYYARAKAVEEIARRTKFAPIKKRESYREARELYRKALSLGKNQARGDLARLGSSK